MIGLGVSSIGDAWTAFGQNVKTLKEYERCIDQGQLPLFRGHFLNQEDRILRKHILNLMCQFNTTWNSEESKVIDFHSIKSRLAELEADGLCVILEEGVQVTPKGRPFVRNICMAFDLRLWRNKPTTPIFSQTV
jgi:oxygen-independent coproporphyrinogen-3 oxidase